MKVKILSDRLVGYKVGQKVDVDKLSAAGVNVRQWTKCGLAEYVRREVTDVELVEFGPDGTDASTEEGDA